MDGSHEAGRCEIDCGRYAEYRRLHGLARTGRRIPAVQPIRRSSQEHTGPNANVVGPSLGHGGETNGFPSWNVTTYLVNQSHGRSAISNAGFPMSNSHVRPAK